MSKITEQQKEYIIAEYIKCEKTYKEIGSDLGINFNTVRTFVRGLVQAGELVSIDRRAIRLERVAEAMAKEKKTKVAKGKAEHVTNYSVDVDCDKVWQTCRFGCKYNGHCDFRACVGRVRILTSPNVHHCHDYEKITKEKPKVSKEAISF